MDMNCAKVFVVILKFTSCLGSGRGLAKEFVKTQEACGECAKQVSLRSWLMCNEEAERILEFVTRVVREFSFRYCLRHFLRNRIQRKSCGIEFIQKVDQDFN